MEEHEGEKEVNRGRVESGVWRSALSKARGGSCTPHLGTDNSLLLKTMKNRAKAYA